MTSPLKAELTQAMKDAMRAKDKQRLGTIRLVLADINRIEVDERTELEDSRVLAVLDKMVKQRRDSIAQYQDAGRTELAEIEQAEIEVIQSFLPQPLSDSEIDQLIANAISSTGASSMQQMGAVMAIVKPQIQGRADAGAVSGRVKKALS